MLECLTQLTRKPGSHMCMGDDLRVIVTNHSRRKFTKEFTHE